MLLTTYTSCAHLWSCVMSPGPNYELKTAFNSFILIYSISTHHFSDNLSETTLQKSVNLSLLGFSSFSIPLISRHFEPRRIEIKINIHAITL
jgi:hypothetical protein